MDKKFIAFVVLFATVFAFTSTLQAHNRKKSAGIGLRGTFWDMKRDDIVTVRTWPRRTDVNVGGGGAWLYFFSRVNDLSLIHI